MAPTLKAVLVCDDVRLEVGNKVSAMGIFHERLTIEGAQGAPGPVALARLAVLYIIAGLRGQSSVQARHRLEYPGWPAALAEPWTRQGHDPGSDMHNFIHVLAPAVFPGPGVLRASLEVQVEEQVVAFHHAIEITFGPAPAQRPLGPGRAN